MSSDYIKAKLRDVKYCDDLSLEAADYIARLEAVVRAGDEIRGWLPAFPAHESSQKADMDAYDAARSRVNLPESPESSATNGTERKGEKRGHK